KNPEIISKFEDSQNRIRAMALVHEKLYRSENLSYIDFARYIKTLSQELFITLGGNARGITIQYSLEEVNLNIDLAIPCGLIITELVSNAIKHAFNEIKDEKKILITLERNEKIKISVKDNGSGLPDDTGIDNSESLGLVLVPMLAKQINGEIRVLNNAGTEFILTFPDA
nr:histidine kinase dimerization/phosphoacceptor domain -containing protein [Spirochaetota bacterium]